MDETNAVVASHGIGLAFTDELTRAQKQAIVLQYIDDYLDFYREDANSALESSRDFIIKNDDELKLATMRREIIRGRITDIEKFHEDRLSPTKKDIRECEVRLNTVKNTLKEAQANFDAAIKENYLLFEDGRLAAQEILNSHKPQDGSFVPDIILPETQKTVKTEYGSTTVRKDIEVEVYNLLELVKYVAACNVPVFFMKPDMAYIKKWVKMMNKTGRDIPGIIIKDTVVVAGRKA